MTGAKAEPPKQCRAGFFIVHHEAWEIIERNLEREESVTARFLYDCLCRMANREGDAWIHRPIAYLAAFSRLSESTIKRRLADLERLQLIVVERSALKAPLRIELPLLSAKADSSLRPNDSSPRTSDSSRTDPLRDTLPKERNKVRSIAAPSATAGSSSDHREFIRLWHERYQRQFGFEYQFAGGKDGKAVKTLLATKLPPAELIAIAESAWPHVKDSAKFGCKNSGTIAGFNSQFNRIRQELAHNPARKPNVPNI